MSLAFAGIRVVDFSQVLAGPGATHLLATQGADVIKIENPTTGDQMRQLMSTERAREIGMSPPFMSINAGKRSLGIDLKHPAAKDIIFKLIAAADVVVENFRAGAIERLGFGYEDVRAVKPDIIYCSMSGYGQQGPMRGVAAYDGAIQAASGMMSLTGHESTGPTRSGATAVDMSTAMTGAFAIASALHRHKVTGKGQRLDVAMLDAAMWLMNPNYSRYLVGGELTGLDGNSSPTGQPTANVFPTADGYMQITVITEPHCEALFSALGLADMSKDPRYADIAGRIANHDDVHGKISATTRQHPTAHWAEQFQTAKIPCAEIRDIPGVLADPQLKHRDIVRPVPVQVSDDPSDVEMLDLIGVPFVANEDGPVGAGQPPKLGEHTASVLQEFGYSQSAIEDLRQSGVFGSTER